MQNSYCQAVPDLHSDNNTASVEEFTIYDLYSKNITKKEMIDSKSQDKTSLSRSQSSSINMKDLIEFVNAYLNKYRKNDTNNIRFQSMNKLDIPTVDISKLKNIQQIAENQTIEKAK